MTSRILRYVRKKYIEKARSVRTFYWSFLFGSLGERSSVLGPITVRDPENIFIGNRSSIGAQSILNARDTITIGNYVALSAGVVINTGGLDYTKKGAERKKHTKAKVVLCDGVWIGTNAIISQGVTIGENSVIGAGAVVTKDIPPNVIAVGVPAKVIKNI